MLSYSNNSICSYLLIYKIYIFILLEAGASNEGKKNK